MVRNILLLLILQLEPLPPKPPLTLHVRRYHSPTRAVVDS